MSFIHIKYLPIFIVLYVILFFLFRKKFVTFDKWIQSTWGLNPTRSNKIMRIMYILSWIFLFIALLDLRGEAEKIESEIPDQKTIIVIDSSASMLAEDVRPNRFKKALFMARHFIKNAAGHQIAVVLFSDIQKRLVPFTDDIDLLDARVAALEDTDLRKGGSNISQAIKESIQYFKTGKTEPVGNILLFTDSEDNGESFELDVPSGVNIAAVGVGTIKGGRIPLRDPNGRYWGNKKFNGNDVITKLDEKSLKDLGSSIKNYKYWIASTYNLPTDQILNFFRKSFSNSFSKGNMTVRPVKGYWLIISFILIYCVSVLIGRMRSYTFVLLVCLILPLVDETLADIVTKEELSKKLIDGSFQDKSKLALADYYIKEKDFEKAAKLYEEYSESVMGSNLTDEENYNLGLLELKLGKLKNGIDRLSDVKRNITDEKVQNDINRAIYQALKQEQQNKDKKEENKEDKKEQNKNNKNQNQDNKKNNQDQNKQDNKQNKGQNKEQDQQKQKKDKEQKNEDKKKKQEQKEDKGKDGKKDKDKNKKDSQGKKKKKKKNKSLKEKEEEIKKKRKMIKLPAMVKQLMGDDRELQKEYFDTRTNKPSRKREKKDW